MKPLGRIVSRIFAVLLILALASEIVVWNITDSFSDHTAQSIEISSVQMERNGELLEIKLPEALQKLKAGEQVVLYFDVPVAQNQYLYVSLDGAFMDVYADGQLVYDSSEDTSLHNIPCTSFSLALPESENDYMHIEMVYTVGSFAQPMQIRPFLVGSQNTILHALLHRYLLSALLSFAFVIIGLFLLNVSFFFLKVAEQGKMVRWPGILLILSGLFCLAANPMVCYVASQPSFMYILKISCFYLIIVPILIISTFMVKTERQKWIQLLVIVSEAWIIGCVCLSASGRIELSAVMIPCQWLYIALLSIDVCFLVETACTEKTTEQILFSTALLVLVGAETAQAVLYIDGKTDLSRTFFEIAISIFGIVISLITLMRTRNAFFMQTKANELANEVTLVNNAIAAQKEKADLMLKNQEELRRQRHDLRHHVTVMQQMMQVRDYDALENYLQKISNELPSPQISHYCDNYAVSALLLHYDSLCQQEGIALDIQGNIPASCGVIADSDLIVVAGNMLENAVEACRHVKGKKEISLHAGIHGSMLMMKCTNSYNQSLVHLRNGHFLSSKHASYGIGTRSIRSMAEKYHGDVDFSLAQKFSVRIYLDMEQK